MFSRGMRCPRPASRECQPADKVVYLRIKLYAIVLNVPVLLLRHLAGAGHKMSDVVDLSVLDSYWKD